MPDGDGRVRLRARHLGQRTAAALDRGGPGRIGALFQRSFYVDLDETWICVGQDCMERGPLHLGCGLAEGLDWRASGLEIGLGCQAGPDGLRIGHRLRIETQDAEVWLPPQAPPWSRQDLAWGLEILEHQVAGNLPEEGLAGLLHTPSGGQSPLLARARPVVARLRDWLTEAAAGDSHRNVPPLDGLVGAGPGLTPSGDDFVCGLLVGLHALERGDLAGRVFAAVLPLFRTSGNPISTAHLLAAAEGAAAAPLHDALAALAAGCGRELPAALKRLDATGHCSGWDALTGLVVALRAAAVAPHLAAHPRPSRDRP